MHDAESVAEFGNEWAPDEDLVALVKEYLVRQPEQGDWAWEAHCEGLALGILRRLYEAGIDLPEAARPDRTVADD